MAQALATVYNYNSEPQQQGAIVTQADKAEQFFRYYQASRGLKDETIKTSRKALKVYSEYLQANNLDGFTATRQEITAYKIMLDNKYTNKHTAKLYFTIAKCFYSFLAKEGYIQKNVADGIIAFKDLNKADTHRRERLTADEVKAVMQEISTDTLKGARDYAILALCFTGAFRRVELYRANIEDIQTKAGAYGIYIQGKGRESKQDFVKIPPKAREALEHYLSLRGEAEPTAPLFINLDHTQHGERLSLVSFSHIAKTRFKQAGIDSQYKTLHSTRHTAISTYLDKTKDLAGSQRLARHLDPKTTMIYIHDLEQEKSKATAIVEEELF